MSRFYIFNPKQNLALHQRHQDHLAEASQSAGMRELTLKDRQHRLHALMWRFTAWRAKWSGTPAEGSRSWDHGGDKEDGGAR